MGKKKRKENETTLAITTMQLRPQLRLWVCRLAKHRKLIFIEQALQLSHTRLNPN